MSFLFRTLKRLHQNWPVSSFKQPFVAYIKLLLTQTHVNSDIYPHFLRWFTVWSVQPVGSRAENRVISKRSDNFLFRKWVRSDVDSVTTEEFIQGFVKLIQTRTWVKMNQKETLLKRVICSWIGHWRWVCLDFARLQLATTGKLHRRRTCAVFLLLPQINSDWKWHSQIG